MKYFKHILILFISIKIITSVFIPSTVTASSITMVPERITVREGETFGVSVGVNAGNEKQYTVRASGIFTPGIMRLSTWKFSDQWTVVRQDGYDSFDNKIGTFLRTGGYPNGFTGNANLGTATFVAGTPGQGIIQLNSGTFIYNDQSANTYVGSNRVVVDVLPALKPVPVVAKPIDHSFDIAIEVPDPILVPGEPLNTTIHLTNTSSEFEKLEVPVGLQIIDTDGHVVVNEVNKINLDKINTQFEYSNSLQGFAPGMYNIVSSVELPDIAEPAISQTSFRIDPSAESAEMSSIAGSLIPQSRSVFFLILGLLFGMLFILILDQKGQKKHEVKKKTVKKIVISE